MSKLLTIRIMINSTIGINWKSHIGMMASTVEPFGRSIKCYSEHGDKWKIKKSTSKLTLQTETIPSIHNHFIPSEIR